jgi:predicted MPP superfamily phosphohydrolase
MRHLVIPDTQCKPGYLTDHLEWAGKYAVKTKPDVIVHLGDHWDMASLSVYDIGKKSFEGRTYSNDVQAGNNAMDVFMKPIIEEQKKQKENKKKVWNPKKVFLIGNHEYRIDRAVESDRKLEGLMGYKDFNLEAVQLASA